MTNLNSILKSRDITLSSSQSYDFSSSHVWMWELEYKESWLKKNWCFWTVALQKALESPLDSKETQPVNPKGNQSWIFIGRTELKLKYFGHLMRRTDLLEKTLMLGKIEGWRRRGQQRMRCLDGITNSMAWVWVNSWSWWQTRKPGVLQSMQSQVVGHDWATELNVVFSVIVFAIYLYQHNSLQWLILVFCSSNGEEFVCNERDLSLVLGQEDSLDKGMATHSSILAWRITWTEEPRVLQSMVSQSVQLTEWLTLSLSLLYSVLTRWTEIGD